ncbi:nitroreductase family protein [Tateyamaria sp. SN6-1]|uniref:nitroreductase family protein n=1 Tax=Tateyamaria sp. SN6-1 TaxID=3092148 RepID=UPI0039F5026B
MAQGSDTDLAALFAARYDDAPDGGVEGGALIRSMAARGSCRRFAGDPVPDALVQTLCATALAAPSKSDLQQRDIVLLQSPAIRARLAALVAGQAWVAEAPMIAVFCGNNRRQRMLHDWRAVPFANDHLDAFFNAACDAAICLGAFVTAAEALGLGCCPISAVRNEAAAVSDLLGLPDHVFPFAGLAFGFPKAAAQITKRLPLGVTCHVDRYSEDGLRAAVDRYDADRASAQPYATQRQTDQFGHADPYTWSEDKVRQYSVPERSGFGAYVRARGFDLS